MTDPALPPSVPVRTPCTLERRVVTAMSREIIRMAVRGGALASTVAVVHRCRGCRKTHVVTLGEIEGYWEMRLAS